VWNGRIIYLHRTCLYSRPLEIKSLLLLLLLLLLLILLLLLLYTKQWFSTAEIVSINVSMTILSVHIILRWGTFVELNMVFNPGYLCKLSSTVEVLAASRFSILKSPFETNCNNSKIQAGHIVLLCYIELRMPLSRYSRSCYQTHILFSANSQITKRSLQVCYRILVTHLIFGNADFMTL